VLNESGDPSSLDMRNLKIVLAYDGTDFCGWQVQPDAQSIQGVLSHAIGRVTDEKVLPQGSGRTDAGVHALAQVATFTIKSSIPVENLVKALNDVLPASIRILEVTEKPPDFHARKSARAKIYRYRIYRGAICSPFLSRYVWHYPYPLNTEAMARAAAFVIGEHDFTSFAAVDPERASLDRSSLDRSCLDRSSLGPSTDARFESNIRKVFDSTWTLEDDELIYTVRGSGFLHHMVRNLVGTFLRVGKGTLQPEDIGRILLARNRSAAGATAPASGLFLVSVEY